MNMLKIIEQELHKRGALSGNIPPVLEEMAKAIPNNNIPYRMKLTLAVSELMLFTSQFRRNILHWNGSSIPINAISFCLAASGEGKDSSVNTLRKCFHSAYKAINDKRKTLAHEKARALAAADGVEDPNDWNTYKHYYNEPSDLFVAPGTVEGFINHLNQLDEAGIGAGYLYSGEFAAQLKTSSTITHNIEFLSEVYDEGKREAKIIRSKENQTKAIINLPVSALFVTSPDIILYEADIKRTFRNEFSSKLARRSFFNYNQEVIVPPTYANINEMLIAEKKMEDTASLARDKLGYIFKGIADYQLTKVGSNLTVSEETRELFLLYKRYNEELAETIKKQYPITKIVRKHLQWKAFKLAGALAIIDKSDIVQVNHYIHAISFVEMLDKDMLQFEQQLNKEPYELFITYMHQSLDNGTATANIHLLKKLGYLQGTSNLNTKLKELVQFASSADNSGIYTVIDGGIRYEQIVKTNACGLSYLPVKGSKESRAKQCSSGYKFCEIAFSSIAEMLQGDYAYSPFKFKDGVRGKDYISSGCKWLCFDIDKSNITDEECHHMLSEINHHIVRTSDKDNPFKFRVLVELDSYVDIEDRVWKPFMSSVASYLSLVADPLPKSQIFFSYSGRKIYSVTDKQPVAVRDHLLLAHGSIEDKPLAKDLPAKQKQAQLADPLTTFEYAYEAEPGGRSLALIRAAKHAKDLGATNEEIINLMWAINNYWVEPMPEKEIENTLISQIRRW